MADFWTMLGWQVPAFAIAILGFYIKYELLEAIGTGGAPVGLFKCVPGATGLYIFFPITLCF
jgi:hypothetical protein